MFTAYLVSKIEGIAINMFLLYLEDFTNQFHVSLKRMFRGLTIYIFFVMAFFKSLNMAVKKTSVPNALWFVFHKFFCWLNFEMYHICLIDVTNTTNRNL